MLRVFSPRSFLVVTKSDDYKTCGVSCIVNTEAREELGIDSRYGIGIRRSKALASLLTGVFLTFLDHIGVT